MTIGITIFAVLAFIAALVAACRAERKPRNDKFRSF